MDSRPDTYQHIQTVQHYLNNVIKKLLQRAELHDQSKLTTPERDSFDQFTEKLQTSTYGSEEYKGFLQQMKPALDHHYAKNRHHPEHFVNGIKDMTLLDLIEMLCDWLAATQRHHDGNIEKSIDMNQIRFNYSNELSQIFHNTVKELTL